MINNSLIVATHQPNYIPWLGYFYKIFNCNLFVFLDDVQFSKTGAHNYHFIKTPEGSLKLKIPVKHKFTDPINRVITNDLGGWKDRHLALINENYSETAHFDLVFSDFKDVLMKEYPNLSELNISIIRLFIDKFNIKTELIKSSEIDLPVNLKSENRIIEICKELNATTYYSGKGAKAYQNEENFSSEKINLIYDDFTPVEYEQLWNSDFISNISILDYAMNYGYDWDFIISKIKKKKKYNE